MRAGAPVPQDLLPDARVGAECWNAGPTGVYLSAQTLEFSVILEE